MEQIFEFWHKSPQNPEFQKESAGLVDIETVEQKRIKNFIIEC